MGSKERTWKASLRGLCLSLGGQIVQGNKGAGVMGRNLLL